MRITLAQIAPKLNRDNLDQILAIVQEHKYSTDLIVFPELALNGYSLQDKLLEDAWEISELQMIAKLSEHVDIVVGAAIRESKLIFNSALYFSDGKLLHKHDKVHLPNYGMFEEARYFSFGKSFEALKTKFGDLSVFVCEDMWHEEVHDILTSSLKPEFVVVLAASPARGFSEDGLEIKKQWRQIITKVSKECNAKVIFVNRVGFEDGLGFWGGSCILDSNGDVLHNLTDYKAIVKTFEI